MWKLCLIIDLCFPHKYMYWKNISSVLNENNPIQQDRVKNSGSSGKKKKERLHCGDCGGCCYDRNNKNEWIQCFQCGSSDIFRTATKLYPEAWFVCLMWWELCCTKWGTRVILAYKLHTSVNTPSLEPQRGTSSQSHHTTGKSSSCSSCTRQ